MAITNNGTKNSLPSGQLPSGYSLPVVTEFTDNESLAEYDLTILKSTVENASNSVTMTAILAAITTQLDGILAADYINTQTVDAWADLLKLSTNYSSQVGAGDWLGTTVVSYQAKVKLYVKTA